jgi:hypothetical protein
LYKLCHHSEQRINLLEAALARATDLNSDSIRAIDELVMQSPEPVVPFAFTPGENVELMQQALRIMQEVNDGVILI